MQVNDINKANAVSTSSCCLKHEHPTSMRIIISNKSSSEAFQCGSCGSVKPFNMAFVVNQGRSKVISLDGIVAARQSQ
jgi:hypothetical protein